MTVCNLDDCTHYGCMLRRKGVQLSPRIGAATATRNFKPTLDPPAPSHYRTVLTEDRPGGFKMPILNPDQSVIRHREAQHKRHEIKDRLAATRAAAAAMSTKGR